MGFACIVRDTKHLYDNAPLASTTRCAATVLKVRERKRWWHVAKGKKLKGLRAMLLRRNPFPTLPLYVLRRDARTRCLLAPPYVSMIWLPTHTHSHMHIHARIRFYIHVFALTETVRFNLGPMRAAILRRWPTPVQPSQGLHGHQKMLQGKWYVYVAIVI